MEILFHQEFSYAEIKAYKDYSRIDDRHICQVIKKNRDYWCVKNEFKISTQFKAYVDKNNTVHHTLSWMKFNTDVDKDSNIIEGIHFFLPSKTNRKRVYMTEENNQDETISLFSYTKNGYMSTTKPRQIRYHYGRILSFIVVNSYYQTIKKDGDKLYIKFGMVIKSRGFNHRYFKKRVLSDTLTLNLKTGNFTIRQYDSKNKKANFTTNSFASMDQFINSSRWDNKIIKEKRDKSHEYDTELSKAYNRNFYTALKTILTGNSYIGEYENHSYLFQKLIYDFFIEKKQIKMPDSINENAGISLIKYYYPTEIFLKKNNRKCIASILDKYGIKSKLMIKIMHTKQVEVSSLIRCASFFGKNYPQFIALINPIIFENRPEIPRTGVIYGSQLDQIIKYIKSISASDEEKHNVVKILNSYINSPDYYTRSFETYFFDILDHLKMIEELRKYYPDIKLSAKSYLEFNNEHVEYTRLIRKIRKGISIKRSYDSNLIEIIEEPIENFKPAILKVDEEFYEEGEYMHHCVGSYADKSSSIIVSLREIDGTDRVTCEYRISDGRPIQHRFYTNQTPPEKFSQAIMTLDQKMMENKHFLSSAKLITVPLVINGIELTMDQYEIEYINLREMIPVID